MIALVLWCFMVIEHSLKIETRAIGVVELNLLIDRFPLQIHECKNAIRLTSDTKKIRMHNWWITGKVRFLFAIMLCIANMIIYGLKVNISTTIIGMTKKSVGGANETFVQCPQFEPKGGSVDIDGPYDWNSQQQGLIQSMYFAGYLVGMFPSGYFADR